MMQRLITCTNTKASTQTTACGPAKLAPLRPEFLRSCRGRRESCINRISNHHQLASKFPRESSQTREWSGLQKALIPQPKLLEKPIATQICGILPRTPNSVWSEGPLYEINHNTNVQSVGILGIICLFSDLHCCTTSCMQHVSVM